MVLVLMAVELLLTAVNLIFVTADASLRSVVHTGQSFALFIIVIAAAEIGIGLAILLRLFRLRGSVSGDGGHRADDRRIPEWKSRKRAVKQGKRDEPGDQRPGGAA